MNRNLVVLFLAQMVFVSGAAMTVTMGGIVGSMLAPAPEWATLPVSALVAGTALGTVPATLVMSWLGRRTGFTLAALAAMGAALIAAYAIKHSSFSGYCLATALTGFTLAFSQQFRFAAAESVTTDRSARAISFILLGSIGGAIVGPQLVASGERIFAENAFIGAAFGSATLFLVAALLLGLGLRASQSVAAHAAHASDAPRPLLEMALSPFFLLAVMAGVIGQGLMTFVMTATPVSMHVMDGHSLGDTAAVIRAHVLAMYVPSLFSGILIGKYGERTVMLWGTLLFAATLVIGFLGREIPHYGGSMVLLGVGWNFLFVGGTSLLVKTYYPSERYRAQAINEAAVFGVSALASLLAGSLLASWGWQPLLLSCIPALVIMAGGLLLLRKRPVPIQV
ncbi:major facilitator superfamily protein [Luminiphilus syltensis NOR5-1B]|uniref:Major facilitator superfamily protein n=1 Tax=Luminiphilus syltensis NOR5-1B TaxID=565045 RepID=B8KWP5_9GAMM|nr:MFS transporter [Luminiphilus syltensis]EED35160.1 major facilitator superfamily protein [Luminiphilus syltensis NOR5-1B]